MNYTYLRGEGNLVLFLLLFRWLPSHNGGSLFIIFFFNVFHVKQRIVISTLLLLLLLLELDALMQVGGVDPLEIIEIRGGCTGQRQSIIHILDLNLLIINIIFFLN